MMQSASPATTPITPMQTPSQTKLPERNISAISQALVMAIRSPAIPGIQGRSRSASRLVTHMATSTAMAGESATV